MTSDLRPTFLAVVVLTLVWPANALAVSYDEGVNGDLSGNTALPTSLGTLGIGANSLVATFGGGDFDLFTFTIGAGNKLDSITLNSYGGPSLSFTGLQGGTVWTAGLGGAVNPTNLLGWTHIGSSMVGTNILDDIGLGSGAIGFTPPLLAGTYTMELQDTGGAVPGSMTFNVVPEPSSLALAAFGVIGVAAWGWRRRKG
jgi:hypothetical protein